MLMFIFILLNKHNLEIEIKDINFHTQFFLRIEIT